MFRSHLDEVRFLTRRTFFLFVWLKTGRNIDPGHSIFFAFKLGKRILQSNKVHYVDTKSMN